MTETFIFMMIVLKIPIVALLWIVWWAIKAEPEVVDDGSDGGTKRRNPRPPRRGPKAPRRDPHGAPAPATPARMRITAARGRRIHR